MAELHSPAIAILASGSGSTAEAFIHATQDGRVDAEVGLVISNNRNAGIFDRVKQLKEKYGLDIQTDVINSAIFGPRPGENWRKGEVTLNESEALYRVIDKGMFAHVALMGYMKILKG